MLRLYTPNVADMVFHQFNDEEIAAFLGLNDTSSVLRERENHRLGQTTYNKSFCYFHLLDKENLEVIGSCGYHTWYLQHARAEIGYSLFNDHFKQQGLMKEALLPILRYGFEVLNLQRIEAFIGLKNEASQRLVKHFGFQYEGKMREHYFKNENLEDSLVFSLLKREFKLPN